METIQTKAYRYRPVLFFALAYLFTWIFWIPAVFVPENTGAGLMVIGLLAPAVVSTLFVVFSGSDALKKDLKNKIIGFYKVRWRNVILAVALFAGMIAVTILLSLAFGQSLDQFSFTEDFSFTGVGIGSALMTIVVASIIEEVGWKGYCEDSIGNYKPKPLVDPTGSRRFVCVGVNGNINFEDNLNHEQLFAQALHLFNNGERFWLNDDEIKTLIAENEPFQHLNDLVEMIGETFSNPPDSENGKWWSLADISALLANRYPSFDPETPFKKIGNTLNDIQFNFKSRRTRKHMEYWLVEK